MPTVPWIRLYQNWPRHRKTMALRKLLGTAEPILCLWLWAAENAADGSLEGMTTEDIENAAGWQGKRGRAVSALVRAGFIDQYEGGMTLHNWQERAGAGVSNLVRRRGHARDHMRSVRANKALTACEQGANTMPANSGETLSLSPDLGTSGSSPLEDPDQSQPRAKSSHDWLSYFKPRYWEIRGRQYGQGEADAKACGRLAELLDSLPVEERAEDWEARERIVAEFLARSDQRTQEAGWSFAFFASSFNGLRIPPERRPKPETSSRFHQDRRSNYPDYGK